MEEIARGNPQWPQAFYDMSRVFDVEEGDMLFARCTFNSTSRNTTTAIGKTARRWKVPFPIATVQPPLVSVSRWNCRRRDVQFVPDVLYGRGDGLVVRVVRRQAVQNGQRLSAGRFRRAAAAESAARRARQSLESQQSGRWRRSTRRSIRSRTRRSPQCPRSARSARPDTRARQETRRFLRRQPRRLFGQIGNGQFYAAVPRGLFSSTQFRPDFNWKILIFLFFFFCRLAIC